MEKYEFKTSAMNSQINKLQAFIEEGMTIGLSLKDLLGKVESIKNALNDGIVRIVLLGSFSDGKTSAIAGLLGRLEDTMKIDPDESSDELKIYRPLGLKEGFEIVDTPGLFGTKEKEIAGEQVKFSEITRKYLSEAHIVIYVCDAVTPLKDSHVPMLKWIMRDLNKLNSTIFVLNKMDEAGYDLTDSQDFERGTKIKRETMIARLRTTINLTPDEERKLHIVCIAADPEEEGLAYWFAKPDEYMRRSHIDLLRKSLDEIIETSDVANLQSSTMFASIKDVFQSVCHEIDSQSKPMGKALVKVKESCDDLGEEVRTLRSNLDLNRNEMTTQLDAYKSGLYAEIKGASVETIEEIVNRELGIENEKVSFNVVNREIGQILSACGTSNEGLINSSAIVFEREFNAQSEFVKGAIKEGTKFLKNVKINGEQVKYVRDIIASGHKFKPWGAIKLAGKITKGLGYAAIGINLAMEFYDIYKTWKANKKLDEMKKELTKALDGIFAYVNNQFKGEKYYENFAPAFVELTKRLEERNDEVEKLQKQVDELESYKSKIQEMFKAENNYVDFEEV